MRTRIRAAVVSVCLGGVISLAGATASFSQFKDGKITIALSGGLDRLDPALTSNGPDLMILNQLYDTLLRMSPDGKLLPGVAKSYETVGANIWRFHLRNDVTFHDGSKLTAADVKFSIERVLDPKLASSHAPQLKSINEVKVLDDYTIDIATSAPDPLLPRRMQAYGGTGRVFIVSKAYVESNPAQTVSDKPMGSGPYKLVEWAKGQKIVLEEYRKHWAGTTDVKAATFTFIAENSTRVNALLNKEVDLIQRLPIADVDRVKKDPSLQVVWTPNGLAHNIHFNCRVAPFNDLELRKAFTQSIDLESIIGGLLGEYGRVLPGPLPPQVLQFDTKLAPHKYDPEAAAKVVQAKSPAAINTNTSDGRYVADREIYQSINAQATAAGFKITPRVVEWGRLIAMISAGEAGPFSIVGWDYSENDASKLNAFASASSRISGCKVPAYDEAAAKAAVELDEGKRTALWQDAQRALNDAYVIAGTWQAASIFGGRKGISWKADFGDNIALSDIKLAP